MAQRRVKILVCDRCDTDEPATEGRKFALGFTWVILDLCELHARQFDQDMEVWVEAGTLVEPTPTEVFNRERIEDSRRVAELRTRDWLKNNTSVRHGEDKVVPLYREEEMHVRRSIPGAMPWRIGEHARERMIERGFDVEDVLRTAAMPEHTYAQPWRGDGVFIYQRGDCRIVCNTNMKSIITVIDRSDATV